MEDSRFWLWWYNQRSGPFTVDRLYRMWKSGDIDNRTPFWSERSKKWLPLLHLLQDMYPDRDRLDQMRQAGITRVKLLDSALAENCDACRKLAGQTCSIDNAPELPPDGCTCSPWCGCLHGAIG